jgi:sarcosine oxidase subunit alpha
VRERVTFSFEGRRVHGVAGQSIGAALHALGVRVLGTSAKYRRPRGLRCVAGACPCCAVRVDGLPGIAACVTPLAGGEVVEREHRAHPWFPADRLSRLAPAGFYYAPGAGRPALWRRAEPQLARLAGLAAPPDPGAAGIGAYAEREVDVLVVGAGERGLRAAREHAAAGRRVLVVDRDHEAGGRLLQTPGGDAEARPLADAARSAGAELLLRATALGEFDEGAVGVVHAGGLIAVRSAELVLATGSYDRELALPDGDRPGVLLAGGAQRLLVRDGVRPGKAPVIVERDGHGSEIAALLADAGVRIGARVAPQDVVRVAGRRRVEGIELRGRRRVACDTVVIAAGTRPANELARQRAAA